MLMSTANGVNFLSDLFVIPFCFVCCCNGPFSYIYGNIEGHFGYGLSHGRCRVWRLVQIP